MINTVSHLIAKNDWGRGGEWGVIERGGVLTFFPSKRGAN